MRATATAILACLLGGVAPAVPALPPLAELEPRLDQAQESELVQRSYEAARAQLESGRIALGPSVYGSVGFAANRDIIDPTRSYAYRESAAGVGLSVPVFGSRLQLAAGLGEREAQLARLDAQRELEHRALLRRLRSAYADYWQAQRQKALAEELLGYEPEVSRAFALRVKAGLLLDSDRLEAESAFALAQRDARLADAAASASLEQLRTLAGPELEPTPAAAPPVEDCAPEGAGLDTALERDPELAALTQVIEIRSRDPRASALYPIQSSLQAGYQGRDELNTGQHGTSAALSWTFSMPVEYLSERRLLNRAAAADLARARLERDIRRRELLNESRDLLARRAALGESLHVAAAQLAAADAAIEERQLRLGRVSGDVLEQLHRARTARYNAAKALVAAESALAHWHADWARFDVRPCRGDAPVQVAAAGTTVQRARGRTLYVWQSAPWRQAAMSDTGAVEFLRLRRAGITRLLVSLDAGEIRTAEADPAALIDAVRATRERGLEVWLLLGEPSWIEPAQRNALLAIVRALRPIPLDGLHLDLEPAQLAPHSSPAALIPELAATLAAVSAIADRPIELSLHPRDLEQPAGEGAYLAEVLAGLHVAPTLMVYAADPQRIASRVAPLMARHPELRFRVAISLEENVPGGAGLGGLPASEREQRLALIEHELASANFDGIALQHADGWRFAAEPRASP